MMINLQHTLGFERCERAIDFITTIVLLSLYS